METTKNTTLPAAVAEGSATQEWTLEAFNLRAKMHLQWTHRSFARPQQGKIVVYNGDFPSNPENDVKHWTWDDAQKNNRWDTEVPYGPGFNCAYIAQGYDGKYHYLIKITTPSE